MAERRDGRVAVGTLADLLLALAVITVVARALGLLCRRFGQPQVIGEIAGGILLGPTLFDGALTRTLFPAGIHPALSTLAQVGVCVFMFLVGLHLAGNPLSGRSRIVLALSVEWWLRRRRGLA